MRKICLFDHAIKKVSLAGPCYSSYHATVFEGQRALPLPGSFMNTRFNLPLVVFSLLLSLLLISCSSLTLEHVDFAWPVEGVLAIGPDNRVEEGRYSLSFPVAMLAEEEFQDSSALIGKSLHVIRDSQGYYFITGAGFRNVYVFRDKPSALTLETTIPLGEHPLADPAMNQRSPYIELLDGTRRARLTSEGMIRGEGQ